ncbi:MAG: DUF120 domain-containing protein [Thermoplasmatales archaeon]|jgi:riboflavin kinase|nr:MAG: DUF120 domain-containing protein [Thermoplasmatales archaeon]
MVLIKKEDSLSFDEYGALKTLARIKKKHGSIRLSSSELGEMLLASQQTASRLLIKMEERGFIKRVLTGKKQNITLDEKGINALYEEMAELSDLLGIVENFSISGTVSSGLGEGRYYVSKKPYVVQFSEKLGIIPYPGTLNVKILSEDESKLRMLRANEGILIEGFESDDRTYGDVKAFGCRIKNVECAAIFPYRSVYKDIIEIISSEYLREKLSLNDGDLVKIDFTIRN